MFYRLYRGIIEEAVDYQPAPEGAVAIGIVTMEELQRCAETLGLDGAAVSEEFSGNVRFSDGLSVRDDSVVGAVSVVHMDDVTGPRDSLGLVLRRDVLLFVDLSGAGESGMLRAMRAELARFGRDPTPEKVVYSVLDALLRGGEDVLAATESRLIEFERLVSSGRIDDGMNRTIFSMRRRLASLSGHYEQFCDLGRRLSGNENDLFASDGLRYFRLLSARAERLGRQAGALLDSLVHLREAVDAALNTSINRVMKLFTVVTTIFLPLTLIVGWYGMNFEGMPELGWRYGYPFVIALSITVVAVTVALFRKRNFL